MNIGDTQKCETCFKGVNTWEYSEYFERNEWGTCNTCGARALSGAQLRDIAWIEEGAGQALIGACLGSRKTGTTVAFINRHRGVWLGVVPLHTIDGWIEAIHEWSPGTKVYVINSKNKTAMVDLKNSEEDAVHLIGWELLRRRDIASYKNIEGAFLDEVHRMSGFGTLTAKVVHKINTKYRIGLSGTPAGNKLQFLWNVLHWIWWGNNDHKTKYRLMRYKTRMWFSTGQEGWIPRHFYVKQTMTPNGDLIDEIGAEKKYHSVVDEIPLYIQHLEDETCCEFHPGGVNATLPPKEDPRIVYVDMTPTQKKAYDRAASGNAVLWLEDEHGEQAGSYIGNNDKVRRLRKRQITLAVPTIESDGRITMKPDAVSTIADAWLSLAEDIVEPGDPVLVFTHSKVFAKMLVERTNRKFGAGFAFEWSGDVPMETRNRVKSELFGQEGGPQVIIAVIASIADGTDGLQKVCRREVWASWEEDDLKNVQAGGRLRRTGQRRRTQRWDIIVRGTDEERIIKNKLKNRSGLQASLLANK